MSKLYPCVHCTEDGHCMKYSDDEVTSWCVQGPCEDECPSKADSIRSMGDTELANYLSGLALGCVNCPMYEVCDGGNCNDRWQRWIRMESGA